nr:RIP metalloprotease RseP [Alkalibacter mobilis]
MFGFLIIIHELGHFLAARMTGVNVLEFAIGMGPVIYSRQGARTKFSLRALPLGGFCKMQGEDESDYSEGSYNSKSKVARIFILASGALMNILGCIILLAVVFFMIGSPINKIDLVEQGYPAYESGMLSGDEIVSINDQKIDSWEDINYIIDDENQDSYELVIKRDGEESKITLVSKYDEELDRFRIGITPARQHGVFRSIGEGFNQTVLYTGLMLDALTQLFTGKASTNDFIGPIGIVNVVGETVQYGAVAMLNLAAVISLNLAIFNLLPIPALDGSRIIFVLIEWIKGSPVDPEKEGMVHLIGFILLIILAIFIAYNDILRLN